MLKLMWLLLSVLCFVSCRGLNFRSERALVNTTFKMDCPSSYTTEKYGFHWRFHHYSEIYNSLEAVQTLVIHPVKRKDSGLYVCGDQHIFLEVQEGNPVVPMINNKTQNSTIKVDIDEKVSLECRLHISNHRWDFYKPSITWYRAKNDSSSQFPLAGSHKDFIETGLHLISTLNVTVSQNDFGADFQCVYTYLVKDERDQVHKLGTSTYVRFARPSHGVKLGISAAVLCCILLFLVIIFLLRNKEQVASRTGAIIRDVVNDSEKRKTKHFHRERHLIV